jgi:hypothetical protein
VSTVLSTVMRVPSHTFRAALRTTGLSLVVVDGIVRSALPSLVAPVDRVSREAWALSHHQSEVALPTAAAIRARTS